MMGRKQKLNAIEHDALCHRRELVIGPNEIRFCKRQVNKRFRRGARIHLRAFVAAALSIGACENLRNRNG